MTRLVSILLLAVTVAACGKGDKPEPPPGPEFPRFEECTATDQALVKNTYLAVLGRRPRGQAEVNLLVDLLSQARAEFKRRESPLGDKAAVQWLIGVLAEEPDYARRWSEHFMDALRIHRIEVQSQRGCYGAPLRKEADGSLAAWVRHHGAMGPGDGQGMFNMADLLRSALIYDDVSTVYRGHLFAMVNVPLPAANVDRIEAELARREDFGTQFDAVYLNRDLVCLACHTTTHSITQHHTPEKNRHWPLRGDFETTLFGHSEGVAAERAHAPFRYDGVVADGFGNAAAETAPWEWSQSCGMFQTKNLEPDPADVDGLFGKLKGKKLSVFDIERSLARGIEVISQDGLTVGEDGSIADPDAAFAYLVAAKIVEGVWIEVVGSPLTISNYFPRNQGARDVLQELTDRFVASHFSLQSLLADIVTSPYMNRLDPAQGCGEGPYNMPAVYDPWTLTDSDPEKRKNGPGDGVAALSSRTMLNAAYEALEWKQPFFSAFPDGGFEIDFCTDQFSCDEMATQCKTENQCCLAFEFACANPPSDKDFSSEQMRSFQRGVGTFLKGGEPGFRGLDFQARLVFEDRLGACKKPQDTPDFIDEIVSSAQSSNATVNDAVVALKDRLVGEPLVASTQTRGVRSEASLLADLFRMPLSTPAAEATDLQAGLRALCGVLLSSPQFLLSGFAGKDADSVPVLTPHDASYGARCRDLARHAPNRIGAVIDCGLEQARITLR